MVYGWQLFALLDCLPKSEGCQELPRIFRGPWHPQAQVGQHTKGDLALLPRHPRGLVADRCPNEGRHHGVASRHWPWLQLVGPETHTAPVQYHTGYCQSCGWYNYHASNIATSTLGDRREKRPCQNPICNDVHIMVSLYIFFQMQR